VQVGEVAPQLYISIDFMVPAEGIEPPTFGLQNRCSTAELSRPRLQIGHLVKRQVPENRHGIGTDFLITVRCSFATLPRHVLHVVPSGN
jgi:hypothetical protein